MSNMMGGGIHAKEGRVEGIGSSTFPVSWLSERGVKDYDNDDIEDLHLLIWMLELKVNYDADPAYDDNDVVVRRKMTLVPLVLVVNVLYSKRLDKMNNAKI